MEVHHHPHAGIPGKKKWTHYIWEFLMLFLAVFCGFIAENIREHKIEHARGRQYIVSFTEDLKTDTINMNLQINELIMQENILNGIYECYDSVTQKIPSTACLKKIIVNSSGFTDFIYTD